MKHLLSILLAGCLLLASIAVAAQDAVAPDEVLLPVWRGPLGMLEPRLEVFYATDRTRGFVSFEHPDFGLRDKRWTSAIYPMWKARVADVDGNGRDELVLGIWSRMKRHDEPSPSRAVWVMSWEGSRLVPLWQGSALSRPLIDFDLADVNGDGTSELLAIERLGTSALDERCFWTLYRWNGFGFWVDARVDISCAARVGPRANCISYPIREEGDHEVTRCASRVNDEWVLQ